MAEQKAETTQELLFTVADKIQIANDRHITHDNDGNWQQIGINHALNGDKKTKWSIKCGDHDQLNLMIGVATKDVVTMKNSYSGQFMYGWVFNSANHRYNFGKYSSFASCSSDLSHTGTFKWARNDVVSVEYTNYTLTLYYEDVQVYVWKMKQYPKLDQKQLIPIICTRNTSCEFLGITEE